MITRYEVATIFDTIPTQVIACNDLQEAKDFSEMMRLMFQGVIANITIAHRIRGSHEDDSTIKHKE